MCRFLAYRGQPILLEELVAAPTHSLIHQSLHATEAKTGTNGPTISPVARFRMNR